MGQQLRSQAPAGMGVVTGPTGCGKTTLLYGCLRYLAKQEQKVITIENPVEYLLPGMVQLQVQYKEGLTFERLLRASLRSDPDVLMLGEIRTDDALLVACEAALTGHKMMTTMHTKDAVRALGRMVELGASPYILCDTVKLVVAQRLVRQLCPDCSEPAEPKGELLDKARQLANHGGLDWSELPREFRAPVGCGSCANTGYRGRDVMVEALQMTPRLAAALGRGEPEDTLRRIAVDEGMTTLAADGIRRAAEGLTHVSEVLRIVGH